MAQDRGRGGGGGGGREISLCVSANDITFFFACSMPK